ncbi:MAG TPA: thiosulfate oxidation carrier protein SoxY [Halothiobacillus sp.]|jgi:sulfur-oxidizing protein SoxY|nr:thiosulfate oxidation carrier protein SoxY [Halothiobacillus sp.]
MQSNRRVFLKGSMAASAVGLAVGAGLLTPRAVMAAAWPQKAYDTKGFEESLTDLFGVSGVSPSKDINVKAPDIAENGAVVPVTIESSIAGTDNIAILVKGNPTPLVCNFKFDGAQPFMSTRIRMGKTDDVIGVAHAGGKLYSASKQVKVTIGGCGG